VRHLLARRSVRFVLMASLAVFGTTGANGQQTLPPTRPISPPGSALPQSQQPARATGLILGRVVDADSGQPVMGAVVILAGRSIAPPPPPTVVVPGQPIEGPTPPPQVFTDGQGRFVFRSLPRGSYGLSARASGYLGGGYGQRRPNGPSSQVQLGEDERKTDVTIKLWRYASIAGMVRDEAGEPAVGVQVTLLRSMTTAGRRVLAPAQGTMTDDRGMYRIGGLSAGTYTVFLRSTTATLPMSAIEEYQKPISGQAAQAARNAMMQELGMAGLSPGSPGIRVGDQQLQLSNMNARSLVAPLPGSDGRMFVYPTTFYPNATTAAQAMMITLASGEDRSGMDLQLRLSPAFRVSGTVQGPDGPAANFGVKLQPGGLDEFATDNGFETSTTATDAFGNFTFLGVPVGQYTVTALRVPRPTSSPMPPPPPPPPAAGRGAIVTGVTGGVSPMPGVMTSITFSSTTQPQPPQAPTEPTLWAQVPVSVGESDLTGVSVVLAPGARIRGRIEFQGSAPRPDAARLQQLTVNVSPADGRFVGGGFTPARLAVDGSFTTMSYPPGSYVLSMGSPGPQWWLRSVMVGGRECVDTPFDLRSTDLSGVVLTFTDQTNELSGTVQRLANAEDVTMVVVLPADYQRSRDGGTLPRRTRATSVGPVGQYAFRNLVPGEYLIAAVNLDTGLDFQDVQLMNAIARAARRVTIVDGAKQVIALTPSTVR